MKEVTEEELDVALKIVDKQIGGAVRRLGSETENTAQKSSETVREQKDVHTVVEEKKGDNWRRGYMQGVAEERERIAKICEEMMKEHDHPQAVQLNEKIEGYNSALSDLRDKLSNI